MKTDIDMIEYLSARKIEAEQKKRFSFKLRNIWKEEQSISFGGYIQYDNEIRELSIFFSLLTFDFYLDILLN